MRSIQTLQGQDDFHEIQHQEQSQQILQGSWLWLHVPGVPLYTSDQYQGVLTKMSHIQLKNLINWYGRPICRRMRLGLDEGHLQLSGIQTVNQPCPTEEPQLLLRSHGNMF